MRNHFLFRLGIGLLVASSASVWGQTTLSHGGPLSAPGAKAREFKTEKEKLSYAMGMSIELQIEKYSAAMDKAAFHEGVQDLIDGKEPRLTLEEAASIVKQWQEKARKGEITFHGEQIKAYQDLSGRNKEEGAKFLAANREKPGVVALPSGLQYKVLKAGDGPKPAPEDTVVCHYRGTLLDGKEFDSSFKRETPATVAIKTLIKGWAEALALMPVGSRWQLFIPESLAFGERSPGGGIGPNSTVLLEVELLGIQKESKPDRRSAALTKSK